MRGPRQGPSVAFALLAVVFEGGFGDGGLAPSSASEWYTDGEGNQVRDSSLSYGPDNEHSLNCVEKISTSGKHTGKCRPQLNFSPPPPPLPASPPPSAPWTKYTVLNSFCDRVPCSSGKQDLTTYTTYDSEAPAVFTGEHWFYGSFEVKTSKTVRLTMSHGAVFSFTGLNVEQLEADAQHGAAGLANPVSLTIRASNGEKEEYAATCEDYRSYDHDGDPTTPSTQGCTYWSFYSGGENPAGVKAFTKFDRVDWVDFESSQVKPHLKGFEFYTNY